MLRVTRVLAVLAVLLLAGVLAYWLFDTGRLRFNYPDKDTYPVRGIDVSHHQGAIDWPEVVAQDVSFAYIKASEGTDLRDPRFRENQDGAAAGGILWGAYHFFTFCTPGDLQAANFLEVVGDDSGDLPPAADVEFSGNCQQWESIEAIEEELRRFLTAVEEATGRRPVIYATGHSHDTIVRNRFPGFPLWIRDIFRKPAAGRFGEWTVWQYSNRGRMEGIDGPVDLNVFAGTREEFAGFANHR